MFVKIVCGAKETNILAEIKKMRRIGKLSLGKVSLATRIRKCDMK